METNENRTQVQRTKLEPDGEQVEQAERERGVVHLVREMHYPPKENQLEAEFNEFRWS